MTGHGDIPMAVQAMKAGAVDFIEKPFKNEFLLERVQRSLTRAVAARKEQDQHGDATARVASLTPREREVMDMLIQGKRNKIIASDLGISNRTVEAHRAKIMEKMQARSLSDVVRLSFEAEGSDLHSK
jgi:two-component system, LuxR family, response regulator FixJ